jgi:heat-inducible transcriptional repressor
MARQMGLSERERLILQAVVHTYITTAEPVGSRTIVKRYTLDLSPATVRNVMADLEETGYLQQLHTSSGRVPTDLGYRYYVDYLMHVQELTITERSRFESELAKKLNDADEVMRQTSHLLALVSHQMGIVEAPDGAGATVHRVELVPVAPERVAVLIADSYGRVHTRMVTLGEALDPRELGRLTSFLNDNFRGVQVDSLASSVERKLQTYVDDQRRLAERALKVLNLLPLARQGQLFLEGATQLIEHPEFRDVAKAQEVFHFLDEEKRLLGLLRAKAKAGPNSGPFVLIGQETRDPELQDISIVTSPYFVGDRAVGAVGVLGPRRMPYSRLTSLVGFTADLLSRFLTRLAGQA